MIDAYLPRKEIASVYPVRRYVASDREQQEWEGRGTTMRIWPR